MNIKNFLKINIIRKLAKFLGVLFFVISIPLQTFAASFSVSPATGSYVVGNTFTIAINVGSGGKVMNAASGTLSFSKDVIEVVSLSKTGSIVNLWVQEPQYSNSMGIVSFEGIVLNPGFNGTGKILTVTFRAKNAGNAKFAFSNGSVLANDGNGTNILKELGTGALTITPSALIPPVVEPKPAPVVPVVPAAQIVSGTIPATSATQIELPLVNIAPAVIVNPPKLNQYPSLIRKGEPIVFTGTTDYPQSTVRVMITHQENGEQKAYNVTTDDKGIFILAITESLSKGVYQFSLQAVDGQGNEGSSSQPGTFVVQSAQMVTFGEHVISMLSIVFGLGALMFIIAVLFVQAWHTLVRMRRKISRHVIEAESEVHEAFGILQDTMKEQIMLLEITRKHRTLTEEEQVVLKSIQKNIKKMEEFVIEDLEKIKRDV